nr:MAG TPA: hypothetical protein [Caudoviricetes sp.]
MSFCTKSSLSTFYSFFKHPDVLFCPFLFFFEGLSFCFF